MVSRRDRARERRALRFRKIEPAIPWNRMLTGAETPSGASSSRGPASGLAPSCSSAPASDDGPELLLGSRVRRRPPSCAGLAASDAARAAPRLAASDDAPICGKRVASNAAPSYASAPASNDAATTPRTAPRLALSSQGYSNGWADVNSAESDHFRIDSGLPAKLLPRFASYNACPWYNRMTESVGQ